MDSPRLADVSFTALQTFVACCGLTPKFIFAAAAIKPGLFALSLEGYPIHIEAFMQNQHHLYQQECSTLSK